LNTRTDEIRIFESEKTAAVPLRALLIGFESSEAAKFEVAAAATQNIDLCIGPSRLPGTVPSRSCGRRYDLVLVNRDLTTNTAGYATECGVGGARSSAPIGGIGIPALAVGTVRFVDGGREDLERSLRQAVVVCTEHMRILHDGIERMVRAAFSEQGGRMDPDDDALLVMDKSGTDVLYANAAARALGAFRLSQITRRALGWQWPPVPIVVDEVVESDGESGSRSGRLTVTAAKVDIDGYPGLAFRLHGETRSNLFESRNTRAHRAESAVSEAPVASGIGMNPMISVPRSEHAAMRTVGTLRRGHASENLREINDAFERDEFDAVFQPIFDAASCGLLGAEVFLRWTDSAGISHTPSQFLPRIERAGLAAAVAQHVLVKACRLARLWHLIGHAHFHVSMNLSRGQLLDHGFVSTVASALAESGVSPGAIEFEFSEAVLTGDDRNLLARLFELASLGVRIVFDDFGNGLASLAHVTKLPLTGLKIAPRLTNGIHKHTNGQDIVMRILELGRMLKLSVSAKCVESVSQALYLQKVKVARMQGFLFAAGLPDDEFTDRFMWICDPVK